MEIKRLMVALGILLILVVVSSKENFALLTLNNFTKSTSNPVCLSKATTKTVQSHTHYFSNEWDSESIKRDSIYSLTHKYCTLPGFNK